MRVKRGRIEPFHDGQLVVALPDLKIIASTLERFGVRPGPDDERPVLGPAQPGCCIRPNDPGRVPAPAGTPHA